MSRIELTGLIGSHPLGALASFGLLRVLSERDNDARLSFVEKDDWIAVLDSAFDTEQNDALSGAAQNPEHASFLVALAADGAKDKSKGFVKPSPFYMASGQQSFLDTLKKIHGHVRKGGLWREALFGPWTYATSEWGAGWDPGTERMHALRFKAPTKDKTACVAGAVWLGFEATPIFPTLSVSGAVHTVGWVEHDRLDHFRWALPNVPIGIDALGVLLAADELGGGNKGKKTRRRLRDGIGAVYESTRHEFGQGYAVFRPARRLA
jgi:hypothetical protein